MAASLLANSGLTFSGQMHWGIRMSEKRAICSLLSVPQRGCSALTEQCQTLEPHQERRPLDKAEREKEKKIIKDFNTGTLCHIVFAES